MASIATESTRLSALSEQPAVAGEHIALSERRPCALSHIQHQPTADCPTNAALARCLGSAVALRDQRLNRLSGGLVLHWLGPNTWLAEAENSGPEALLSQLRHTLPDATVTDLSHARTIIVVQGSQALDVIAQGCALDLERLPVGASVPTQIEHFSIQLVRLDTERWELWVYRSFGRALWDYLLRASAEYR